MFAHRRLSLVFCPKCSSNGCPSCDQTGLVRLPLDHAINTATERMVDHRRLFHEASASGNRTLAIHHHEMSRLWLSEVKRLRGERRQREAA